jgi:hypothetical protein
MLYIINRTTTEGEKMTHEQEEEREALLETRAKGKRDDDRIERDEETIKRFLRGGFRGSLGGQLLTDDEHEVVCAHIEYLAKQAAEQRQINSEVSQGNQNLKYFAEIDRDHIKDLANQLAKLKA